MANLATTEIVCKNGASVTVRSATETDAASVIELQRQLLTDGEGQIRLLAEHSASVEDQQAMIRRHLDHPDWLCIVAERGAAKSGGELVGCLHMSTGPHARLAHRGVLGMGVTPRWRGRGIGGLLLCTLVSWAVANPTIEKLSLAVIASNARAIALYEKRGFVVEGRRVGEVKLGEGRYADDILMYRRV
ncbi:putative acetyltransferase YhhY [Pseudobythopirellula maris]|uniref:Putative acetyltransferase YhhY n=1 Tax=Pseudobythopirellula maris TaxID=2527991 RepID=A0A5C5ZRA5_9BACT|nr:GNAT family N-acetyltransferase [Pseudobythopirellula maris]TWT89766.1 putative acetyltransferase YhhY [Pseudobythopirellula maris]